MRIISDTISPIPLFVAPKRACFRMPLDSIKRLTIPTEVVPSTTYARLLLHFSAIEPQPICQEFSCYSYEMALRKPPSLGRSAWLFAALCASIAPAQGAPVITIKAATAIDLDPIRRIPAGVAIVGRVIDQLTTEPLPHQVVTISLDGRGRRVSTDARGQFQARFQLGRGVHSVEVTFKETEKYGASSVKYADFDINKQPLKLTLSVPEQFEYGGGTLSAVVKAGVEDVGVAVSVQILLASVGTAASTGTPVVTLTTDDGGRGMAAVASQDLGAPGRKILVAHFAGNDTYDEAFAHASLLLRSATQLQLELRDSAVSFESKLRVTGIVVDAAGGPVEDAPIAIFIAGRRMAESLTNREGAFRTNIKAEEIGTGSYQVYAVHEPSAPWYAPATSDVLLVTIDEPDPVPVGYTFAAFGATALAMLAFFGLRNRPWQRWKRRQRRKRGQRPSPGDTPSPEQRPHTGLRPSRTSLVSTLRKPHDRQFSGTVDDALRGRPIARAHIRVRVGEDMNTCTTNQQGRFCIDELPDGAWRAEITAPGFVAEHCSVTIPHRGELRNAHISLMPVRERIFEMYRDLAEPLLPQPKLWGVWTPRQIFHHIRANQPVSALAELTNFVEETYFSQRVASEHIIPQAQRLIELAAQECTGSRL